MKIIIKGGRVIDPANHVDKIMDVAIENGKIAHLSAIPFDFKPEKIITANNHWVLPGFIDVCCRPQIHHPHGITLYHEAQCALQRGFTTLCIPPDSAPIIDTPSQAARFAEQGQGLPHLYPLGALTSGLQGKAMADLTSLVSHGCIAFTNAQQPIQDLRILRHCYEYAASFNLLVVIQPQEPALAKDGVAHEGLVASRLGLPGIPETAETIAIMQHLLLIEQSGVRAHFTCLSTKNALKYIATAKAQGLKVSADTAMHSLHLTEIDICQFDANCHVYPPLRSISDLQALLNGIADGTIDAICSDHRPLDTIAKLAPFGETIPGMSTLDTFFSLGLHLVTQNQLPLATFIGAITARPAQLFNIPGGSLSRDGAADICIVDPHYNWQVEKEALLSKGKNTPFIGWKLSGKVTHTLLGGKVVHEA